VVLRVVVLRVVVLRVVVLRVVVPNSPKKHAIHPTSKTLLAIDNDHGNKRPVAIGQIGILFDID
jgi:hypothetical protein